MTLITLIHMELEADDFFDETYRSIKILEL